MKRIIPFLLMMIFAVSAGAQQWSNQGPVLPPEGTVTNGQINCLAFNPLNPLKMWAGAPAGGLWVSSDGGATWLSGATDTLAVTGISDIWVSPSDSNTFVIAVGDRDENSSFVPQGGALYLTTDGGVSWSRSGELDTNGSIVPIPNYTSARVLRNTTTGGYVLATSAGVYTSTSFTPNWNNRVMRERSWDLKQRPNDPSTIYAVIGGRVYRSTNAGTSFTALTTGYPNAVAVRVQLAVAPSNANVVYALYVQPDGTFGGIYKSNDTGNTWTVRSTSPNILAANIDGSGSKGVNNLSLAVSPQNENILLAGGVNVWRSVDGGITWQQSSHYAGGALPYVAADIHDLRFAPSPRSQFVYAATGNGIFMSSDTGRTWQNASAGLQTHQGLASAWHPTRDSLFLTAGPTGIHRYDRGAWKRVSDSASSSVWYHPSDLRYAFASTVSGRLLRSSDSAKTFTGDITPAGAAAGGSLRPYVPNPRNTATVYGILRDVWKTTNGGTSWIRTSNPFNATMLSLAVSRGDTNMVYIVTSDTVFYQSTNGGREWLRKGKIQLQFPVVPRAVICHPFDPLRACVYGGRSVSMTRDGGATWEKYVLNGNVAIMSMSWKQDNCGEALILGTTNGVWRLSAQYNFGVPEQVGSGLPNTPVNDVNLDGRFLRATTAGRGVYATFIDDAGVIPRYTQEKDTICPGDAIQFTDVSENGGLASTWRFEGGFPSTSTDAAPIVRFDTPGPHVVTLIAANGCGVDSVKRASVIVTPRLKAAVSVTRDDVCLGDTVLLRDATIGNGGVRTWSVQNADVVSTTPLGTTVVCSKAGPVTASLVITNACGTSDISKTINVFDPPSPVRITVTKDTLTVPQQAGVQYQWYANGATLTGATGYRWIGRYDGSYTVRLRNQGGCTVYADTVAYIVPKDTSGGSSVSWSVDHAEVSPNPVVDVLRFRISGAWAEPSSVVIRDVTGREVGRGAVGSWDPERGMLLDISALPPGTYSIHADTALRRAHTVFVKMK